MVQMRGELERTSCIEGGAAARMPFAGFASLDTMMSGSAVQRLVLISQESPGKRNWNACSKINAAIVKGNQQLTAITSLLQPLRDAASTPPRGSNFSMDMHLTLAARKAATGKNHDTFHPCC